jgi:hypothetical protein
MIGRAETEAMSDAERAAAAAEAIPPAAERAETDRGGTVERIGEEP